MKAYEITWVTWTCLKIGAFIGLKLWELPEVREWCVRVVGSVP